MGGKRVKRIYDNEGNLVSKECSRCHEIKSVSEFYKDIDKSDRLRSKCKECDSKRHSKKRRKILIKNYDNKGNLISKECSYCHEVKLVSEFNKREKSKDGLFTQCKKCKKIYDKKYYQENKESKKEYQREYQREYYQENKESRRKYSKKYREENKESRRKYDKKRYQENPDYYKEHQKEYDAKKRQEALQQNKKEIESNPEKYNYREGEKIFGVIYLVHNIKSNKYYVGQTTTVFDIRYPSGWLYEHGCKNEVKEDLELYGENSFEYIKIFKVAHSQYELDKLEAYYIDYYDSYENGYNETRGNIFTNRGKEK